MNEARTSIESAKNTADPSSGDFPWAEQLSIDDARLRNILAGTRKPLVFDWPDAALATVVCRVFDPARDCVEPARLSLAVGDLYLDLYCNNDMLASLTQTRVAASSIDRSDASALSLWLEYACLSLIERLEALLDRHIAFLPALSATVDPALTFEIGLDDRTLTIPCGLHRRGADDLINLFSTHWPAKARSANNVPITVRWLQGEQDLSLAEWRSLQRGDVVMLATPLRSMLVIGDYLVAETDIRRPVLRAAPTPMTQSGDVFMTDEDPAATASGGEDENSRALDEMPVRVTCQLAQTTLALSEIRQLEQGSVLAIGKSPDAVVDILLNGRRMGRGSLVRLGEGVGVRIDTLAVDD